MYQQAFGAMFAIIITKFMLNDVPHMSGFYDKSDSSTHKNPRGPRKLTSTEHTRLNALEEKYNQLRTKGLEIADQSRIVFEEIESKTAEYGIYRPDLWHWTKGPEIIKQYPDLGKLKNRYEELSDELRFHNTKMTRVTLDIIALRRIEEPEYDSE